MAAGDCTVGKGYRGEKVVESFGGGRKGTNFVKMNDVLWEFTYGLQLFCRLS